MMANTSEVRIEGLEELARALKELPKRVARNGLRASVHAGAKVIRDEARLKAPVATQVFGPNQQPPGTLKRAIIMKQISEKSDAQKQVFYVAVRRGKQYRNQGKKGTLSQDAYYAHFVEFGTVKMSARPFMRPAFEGKKGDAVEAIRTRLAERVEAAAQDLSK